MLWKNVPLFHIIKVLIIMVRLKYFLHSSMETVYDYHLLWLLLRLLSLLEHSPATWAGLLYHNALLKLPRQNKPTLAVSVLLAPCRNGVWTVNMHWNWTMIIKTYCILLCMIAHMYVLSTPNVFASGNRKTSIQMYSLHGK